MVNALSEYGYDAQALAPLAPSHDQHGGQGKLPPDDEDAAGLVQPL